MRLVIAEKPSLGRAIAEALGIEFRSVAAGAALQAEGLVITWVFGHILEPAAAEAYDPRWKSWRQDCLPLRIKQWRYEVKHPKQLKVIAGYLRRAKEVVHAGDPDREGQLLVDEVLRFLGWRGKTLRLLLNATDAFSVRKAWSCMRPNEEFEPLYRAGLCRQRADWLVGINATRAATLLATTNGALVAVGRVMTPTLSLVVKRDLEIENFVSRDFWRIAADVRSDCGQVLRLVHDPQERIEDRDLADRIAREVNGQRVLLEIAQDKHHERSPVPWHLGDFQREMQRRWGWKLAQSLQILQSLYEKRLVSYPRTECRYLPEEQADQAIPIAVKHAALALEQQWLRVFERNRSRLAPKPWVYDNRKVAEHHGIVPTLVDPRKAGLDERQWVAWRSIVEHFIKTLMPSHEYMQTTISFVAAQRSFVARGKVSLNWDDSWRCLEPRPPEEALPELASKRASVLQTHLLAGKTTAPQHYTEASLSADMESVAKYATDERVKAKLKETSGIGTAATRAPIIEKLKRYGMIEEFKKVSKGRSVTYLRSTAFGRQVIAAMPGSLKDAALTAAWEEALAMIAGRAYDADDFMTRLDGYVQRVVAAFRSLPARSRITEAAPVRSAPSGRSSTRSKAGWRSKSVSNGARS